MSFNPDPDKILASFERVREAFARAAAAPTGAAQPLFVRLSDKFNKAIDDAMDLATQGNDPQKIMMQILPAAMDIQFTVSAIKREGLRNPAAAEAIQELENTMRAEIAEVISQLGDIPGLPPIPGLPNLKKPTPPQQPPANENNPPVIKPQPPKKGGGSWKI